MDDKIREIVINVLNNNRGNLIKDKHNYEKQLNEPDEGYEFSVISHGMKKAIENEGLVRHLQKGGCIIKRENKSKYIISFTQEKDKVFLESLEKDPPNIGYGQEDTVVASGQNLKQERVTYLSLTLIVGKKSHIFSAGTGEILI